MALMVGLMDAINGNHWWQLMTLFMTTLSCNNIFVVSYDTLFQCIVLRNIRLSFFIIVITVGWDKEEINIACNG
jgi:hypothetical protein